MTMWESRAKVASGTQDAGKGRGFKRFIAGLYFTLGSIAWIIAILVALHPDANDRFAFSDPVQWAPIALLLIPVMYAGVRALRKEERSGSIVRLHDALRTLTLLAFGGMIVMTLGLYIDRAAYLMRDVDEGFCEQLGGKVVTTDCDGAGCAYACEYP